MGQYNLNRILKARHVAVVGAIEKAGTIGTALMRNLIDGGYSGMLLPVNPIWSALMGAGFLSGPSNPKTAHYLRNYSKCFRPRRFYFRFFGILKELRPEMLAQFTQIDYDREIALVAIDEDWETDRMLGVARIIGDPDGKTGEFAAGERCLAGQGIGSNLLEKCLSMPKSKALNLCTVSCR